MKILLFFALVASMANVAPAGVLYTDFGNGTGNVDLSYESGDILVPADGSGNGYGNGNTGSLPIVGPDGGLVGSSADTVFYGRFLWAPGRPNDYLNFSTFVGGGRISFHSDTNAGEGGTRVRLFDITGAAVPNIDLDPSPTGTTLVIFRIEMSGPDRAGPETVKIWYNPTSLAEVSAGTSFSGSGVVDLFDSNHRGFGIHNPQITGDAGITQYDHVVFGDTAADVLSSATQPPLVNWFTVSESDVSSGAEVTLSWDVTEADSVEISPSIGILGDQGSESITLTETTIYSLRAENAGGVTTRKVQVTVDGLALSPLINEFVADNEDGLRDGRENASDWIEIHNPNLFSLDLTGYFLTDDSANLTKWAFPEGTVLAGEAYLEVFASGEALSDPDDFLHTNFSLDADGEYLALVAPSGTRIVQEFAPSYPPQQEDVSYSSAGYHLVPTPGAPNEEGAVAGFVADTKFNPDRGFYTELVAVTITTATPGALIYFTTDGSEPSPGNGQRYIGPVLISATTVLRAAAFYEGFEPSGSDSQSYLFAEQVGSQEDRPDGYPTSWGGGPADYEMDPEVIAANPPERLVDSLQSLPTLSLALSVGDLFGGGGIYANPGGEGAAWERAGSAEMIHPDGVRDGFGVNCGVRIQGKSSRTDQTPKHSLSLRFRKKYGAGKLRYPVFQDDPLGDGAIERFDFLQLRAVSNFSFHHWHYYQTKHAHPNRDGFGRDLYLQMGHHNTHGRWVHLYLNGLYWGVYNLHERGDGDHMSNYFGGEPEDYDTLKENRPLDGTSSAWATLRSIVDSPAISTEAGYARVEPYLDLDAFIDYILLNFYVGNRDWGSQNWMVSRRREANAPFRMLTWDMEFSMTPLNNGGATMSQALSADLTNYDYPPAPNHVHQRLTRNAAYRQRFADRVQKHCFGKGVLSPTAASALWQLRANELDVALFAESARWGDHRRDVNPSYQGHRSSDFDLYTVENTTRPVNDFLVGTYFPQRRDIVLAQLRNRNLFPSLDAPVFTPTGGSLAGSLEIDNPNTTGTVFFTTDGSDPIDSPTAQSYNVPVALVRSGLVKARVYDGSEWSALNESTFIAGTPAAAGNLVVSEIFYNPPGASEEGEFIEVMNRSDGPIDLTGVAFTAGIAYSFPAGLVLAAGERSLVSWSIYEGQLDNGGEQITLFDAGGNVIESFSYDDDYPWPSSSDGGGDSLVRVAPDLGLDPSDAENWRASRGFGGTPGSGDALFPFTGEVNADLNGNGQPDLIDHATGGTDLRFSEGQLLVTRRLGADDVRLVVECSTDLFGWQSLDSHFVGISRIRIGETEEIRHELSPSLPNPSQIFLRSRAIRR